MHAGISSLLLTEKIGGLCSIQGYGLASLHFVEFHTRIKVRLEHANGTRHEGVSNRR